MLWQKYKSANNKNVKKLFIIIESQLRVIAITIKTTEVYATLLRSNVQILYTCTIIEIVPNYHCEDTLYAYTDICEYDLYIYCFINRLGIH